MGFLGKVGQAIGKFAGSALGLQVIPSAVQFGANMISAKKEREYATDMWNKQNQYNSPVQQLARYREAGMNPAYGAAMSSGNATPMPPAASSVAKLDVPNILQNLGMYQTLQNQVKEGARLDETIRAEQLKNQFLTESMPSRINLLSQQEGKNYYDIKSKGFKSGWEEEMFKDATINPLKVKYQLDSQALDQRNQMFEIDLALNKIGLNRAAFGLTDSDSAFLRVLAQMNAGNTPNFMLPYVIGEGAVNFLGGAVQKMVPSFGKFGGSFRGNNISSTDLFDANGVYRGGRVTTNYYRK